MIFPGRSFFPPLCLLLMLGGCAASGDYPSLAPRPVEKAPIDSAAPSDQAASPASSGNIATAPITASADKGHADFLMRLEEARSAVGRARGAAPGSEAWVAAQLALSGLDAARGPVLAALADLDRLRITMLQDGRVSDAEALQDVSRAIEAKESEEREALRDLSDALPTLSGPEG